MKKIICLALFFIIQVVYGLPSPEIYLSMDTPKSTVYFGESLVVPVVLNYQYLRDDEIWYIPSGVSLYPASGPCPAIPYDKTYYLVGVCTMNLVIPGAVLGNVLSGQLVFKSSGHGWEQSYGTPFFSVRVIPHPLALRNIPHQKATIGLPFALPVTSYVNYYDENVRAKYSTQITVSPAKQDGLYYDAQQHQILGAPERAGVYWFHVVAKATDSPATAADVHIDVAFNAKDTPVFKSTATIPSAVPGEHYTLNLMDLMQQVSESNQIIFQIQFKDDALDWLHISNDVPTLLEADIPEDKAGGEIELSLVAVSNTGGHSTPYALKIPVAYDAKQQPVMQHFVIEQGVGSLLHMDIAPYIIDPTADPNLQLTLHDVQPPAPWLRRSYSEATVLEGVVPLDAMGQTVQLTLSASNTLGGRSKTVTVPLHITTDQQYIPYFKAWPMVLPMLYAHQSYSYDFQAHADVVPEYDTAPYTIRFAEEWSHPEWLHLENNVLLATEVPELTTDLIVPVVIQNTPGGTSERYELKLTVMKQDIS